MHPWGTCKLEHALHRIRLPKQLFWGKGGRIIQPRRETSSRRRSSGTHPASPMNYEFPSAPIQASPGRTTGLRWC